MTDFTLKELVESWREAADAIDAEEAALELRLKEDKKVRDALKDMVLAELQRQGVKNYPLKGWGTTYTSEALSAKVEDAEAFFAYVLETGQTELLERRASKTAVQEFIETHKQPPPGVKTERKITLCFRREK